MRREKFIREIIGSMWLTLIGFFSLLIMESRAVPLQDVSATNESSSTTTNTATNEEISPFLVIGVGYSLYSLPYTWPAPPDQSDALKIYTGTSFFHYIPAISYHFRLRLLFWSTTDGKVYTASFKDRTKLTNVTFEQVLQGFPWDQLVISDLAVDWISDKLYFTVRDEGRIEERDLKTGAKRVVLRSEESAAFNGLAVFPYPNLGWLFFTDNQGGNIERVAVSGEGRVVIRGGLGRCIWPLEIDYQKQAVYWVNICENTLRSLQVNDTLQSADTVPITTTFDGTSSMTLFDDVLYWNEGGTVKAINKSINMGDIVEIYRVSDSLQVASVSVELIHPKKQPQVDEFIRTLPDNKTCPSCVNGRCITLGLCICDNGWEGSNCTTDIDECALEMDDCEYKCNNAPGGFYCSCNSSSYLDSDGRTCILASPTTTYVVSPTVSSYGLEETSTVTSTVSLAVTTSPTLLPTTSRLSTTSVLSVVSSTPALPTPSATRPPFTPSSMVSGPAKTPTTASETTQSATDSSTDSLPITTEPAADGMTLIIIASAAAGACVILIIVVVIVIAAVVHYVSKRCGSYTVNPDPTKSSSGTPSWITVHSSPSSAPNQANGLHSNGHSFRTKTFRDTSPTCSSNSFS